MAGWMERYRGFILVVLVTLALAGAVFILSRRPEPPQVVIVPPEPTSTPVPVPTPTPAPLRIYVCGAVAHPDVYLLPAGALVKDALIAAGGATAEADLTRINLALEVSDQQQIYVPRQGEEQPPIPPPTAPQTSSQAGGGGGLVNLNTATVEELDALPGIGPTYARRIIEYRETHGSFQSIEEIMQVKGIGQATFEKIKDLITTGAP